MSILKLTDICKDYIQGKEPVRVLKNVCLEVEQGDYIAIMGPSGSGKSTLMNIIGCLDVPTSGEYVLDGKNLHDLKDDDLAEVRNKYIGFVFQSYYLMPKMDAVDNVALPLLYADVPLKERRERAAESLGRGPVNVRLSQLTVWGAAVVCAVVSAPCWGAAAQPQSSSAARISAKNLLISVLPAWRNPGEWYIQSRGGCSWPQYRPPRRSSHPVRLREFRRRSRPRC